MTTQSSFSIKKWRQILSAHPEANFLQSPEWATVNQKIGHQAIAKHFGGSNFALMIIKNAKRGRYLEIPGGPLLDWSDQKLVEKVFAKIRQIAKAHKCVFVRFRPQLLNTPENLTLLPPDAKPAPFHLHAEHTVMIDLEKSEDELLKNMRRQTRYEVRRSAKFNLKVAKGNSKDLFRIFHEVQSKTAARQNFIPPRLPDLLAYRSAFGPSATIYYAFLPNDDTRPSVEPQPPCPSSRGSAAIARQQPAQCPTEDKYRRPAEPVESIATRGNKVIDPSSERGAERGSASISADKSVATDLSDTLRGRTGQNLVALGLILVSGPEADYFEAASTDLNRKLPGAYALQWQVIKDLKNQGIKRYNLWGIAPKDQPHHRYAKVTTFKTGFGGEITEYIPAQDIVISRPRYLKTYLIETIRKKRRHLS